MFFLFIKNYLNEFSTLKQTKAFFPLKPEINIIKFFNIFHN